MGIIITHNHLANQNNTSDQVNTEKNDNKGKKNFPVNKDICYNDAGLVCQLYKSFYSRPLDKINIPEIRNLEVGFQYNYYTVDERVRSDVPNTKTLINIDIDNSDELFYRIKTEKKPRYTKVSFKKPKINNKILKLDPHIEKYKSVNIDDKILIEGALSNEIFTGFELIDTNREEKMYSMLKAAQNFIGVRNKNDSERSAAEKLHDTLSEKGGLYGQDKKLIIEALATLKAQGLNPQQDNLERVTAINDEDPIGRQTFSVQCNNLCMNDLITAANKTPDNVYQDELRGLQNLAMKIEKKLISKIPNVNTFSEVDYELEVPAINAREMLADKAARSNYPQMYFFGYIVEKYELLPNEGVKYIGKRIIRNPNQNYIVDYDVVYGHSYFYKVRTLCRVEAIVSSDNSTNKAGSQVLVADIFVASEGVTDNILCVEKIAPPPPTGIRATFDFKTLLPRLTWQFPLNKQRDIKRFQIFKRFSINEPFILISEYDFDNSKIRSPVNEIAIPKNHRRMKSPRLSFIDTTHKEGEKPIYTIACVDAHGLSSNYGPQVMVERNRYTNVVKRTIISGPNAPKPYPNLLINKDGFVDAIKVSNYKKMKLFFDPEYYRVFEYKKQPKGTFSINSAKINAKNVDKTAMEEEDLNFLAIDPEKFTYKLHLLNVDNQKDQIIKIKLIDRSSLGSPGNEVLQPAEKFSRSNISFQFGVD